jgi:glutathione peroxidase
MRTLKTQEEFMNNTMICTIVLGLFACNTPASSGGGTPANASSGALPKVDAATGVTKPSSEAGTGTGTPPINTFKCEPAAKTGELYALSSKDIADYEDVSMCQYRGKVLLVFNGASKCGNTPQYRPLQQLFSKYEAQGFVALGFPCNQFGQQELETGKEISTFCTNEYGIKFPIFAKLEVNGPGVHPIFAWLKSQPIPAGDPKGDITWNFEKFLVSRDGKLARRFAPETQPDAPEVVAAIQAELAKPAR